MLHREDLHLPSRVGVSLLFIFLAYATYYKRILGI
jgi:hypothetical protein